MMTLRSSEKNTAWRRLFSDLNTVWPTYCSSIKPKVEKYSFVAGMVSACRVGSLLKMEMRKCGANRMTAQIVRVYTKAIRAMEAAARSTLRGRRAP